MSQKSTRRGRRHTNDEDNTALSKLSLKKTQNGGAEEPPKVALQIPQIVIEEASPSKPETNGNTSNEKLETTDNEIQTRSRSQTPQSKKEEKSLNGNDLEVAANEEIPISLEDSEMKPPEEGIVLIKDSEGEMMDPLILTDEPDPELLFEENSDLESGKGSPTLYRSKTRRSLNRNIPTPKTPKSAVDETEAETPPPEAEEDSENMSTRVEVGSDATRLDYNDEDSSTVENNFLNSSKNKSFGETLRHLSTRRTIRPISDDYRKRAIRHNFDFSASSYPTRNSVDRISLSGGLKRKQSRDHSSDEEDSGKRVKLDGSSSNGFFARFTSPLKSIRNSFRGEAPASSTPKLTGYKDQNCSIEDERVAELDEKRWCSIM